MYRTHMLHELGDLIIVERGPAPLAVIPLAIQGALKAIGVLDPAETIFFLACAND